jgi:uncharacterized membrane protein YphA (DoxX/SURF4 family)
MSQAGPIATDRSRTSPPSRPGFLHFPPGRILLGLILVFGAYSKLHLNGAWHFRDYHFFFAMAIGSYRTLPLGAVEWLALVLPWLELTLGALLIVGVGIRWTSLIAGALLVYMAQMPRAAILGLAGRTNPATELLVDICFFWVALALAMKAFQSPRARRHQS